MKALMTSDTIGGVWTYSMELIRAFERSGVSVALATMGRPLTRQQHQEVLQLKRCELHESHYRLEWMSDPWEDVDAAGEWLQQIAAQFQPHIIHLNGYAHASIPWECPVIVVGHSCVYSWFQHVKKTAPGTAWTEYFRRVQNGLHSADCVVAPTQAMLNDLEQHYGIRCRSQVISNGRSVPAGSSIRRENFLFAAGRIWDEAKNLELLTTVANEIPWPIYVAGDQRHPDGGEARLPANMKILGPPSSSQMQEWYRRAAIYLLPARYEPFGLTALEAANAGCALLLADIPTLHEVWGDRMQYVSPDCPHQWSRAIRRLIDHPDARIRLAAEGMRRATRYTPQQMAESYLQIYRSVMQRPIQKQTAMEVG